MHSEEMQMKANNEAQPNDYKDALDMVYEISSILDKYTTEEVLFYAPQTLSRLMGIKDVSIYTVVNKKYARLFSSTSKKARTLGNSIDYAAMEDMYGQLMDNQVYINKDGNEQFPSMAGAVCSEDEIQLILMFWGIPSQNLTVSDANHLTVIIALIQNSILRAKRYMSSFRCRNHMEGTSVLTKESFTELTKAFLDAKSNGLTECILLEIVMGYDNYTKIARQLTGNIRQTDYMGIMEEDRFYILLTNTDADQAKAVQERIHKLGYNSRLKENII